MSNPTSIVPAVQVGFDDYAKYLPYPTGTADTFYPGEMIGMGAKGTTNAGYGQHFDDTQALIFCGIYGGPKFSITTDLPSPILLQYKRPRFLALPLSSGTTARPDAVGQPVFAVDSGHVQLGSKSLTYGNYVGVCVDILSANPEDLTGATMVLIDTNTSYSKAGQYTGKVLTLAATGAKTLGVEIGGAIVEVTSTAAQTLTLPPAANMRRGEVVFFKKVSGGTFTATVAPNGTDLIDGANASNGQMTANNKYLELTADPDYSTPAWWITAAG